MGYFVFRHRLLDAGVTWKKEKAKRIELNPSKNVEGDLPLPEPIKAFFAELKHYLEGRRVNLNLPLDTEELTPFQKEVYAKLARVPAGKTLSYARLARMVGREKATRAVGGALAKNPFPLVIPCHRVIGSNGSLGGFSAGVEVKRMLLELEQGTVS